MEELINRVESAELPVGCNNERLNHSVRVQKVANELVVARIIHSCVGFGKLPDRSGNSLCGWCEDLVDGSEMIPFRMWQAEFYGQWLQSPIFLQEEDCSGRINLSGSHVYSPDIRHECIMVVQYEEPVFLNRLQKMNPSVIFSFFILRGS